MEFRSRHPLLVLVWTFGLFVVLNLPLFIGKIAGSLLGGLPLSNLMSSDVTNPGSILGNGLGTALIGIPFGLLVIRWFWRRDFHWMRLGFRPILLIFGIGVGLVMTFAIIGIEGLWGHVQMTANPSHLTGSQIAQVLVGDFLFMAFVGFVEESTFRGMAVREWAVRWGWVMAALVGGVYFGVMHLGNLKHLGVWNTLQLLIAAVAVTLLFVALYVRSHSLWLPIGFHLGWNFSLMAILGTTMSGSESAYSLLRTSLSGSGLVTGGQFGVEASIFTIAMDLICASIVLFAFRKRTPCLSPLPENQKDALVPEGDAA